MKKLFTIVLLLVTLTMQAQQKKISHIETTKNWYYIYDESGKKIKMLYRSGIGDIKGWGKETRLRVLSATALSVTSSSPSVSSSASFPTSSWKTKCL